MFNRADYPLNILVIGGARSGKSTQAAKIAQESDRPILYVAAAEQMHSEMRGRMEKLRSEHERSVETIEEPINLAAILANEKYQSHCIIIDTLDVWLQNVMDKKMDIAAAVKELHDAMEKCDGMLILVSNEGGMGMAADNQTARTFRDEAGKLHQSVAEACDVVLLTVAGYPITVKGI